MEEPTRESRGKHSKLGTKGDAVKGGSVAQIKTTGDETPLDDGASACAVCRGLVGNQGTATKSIVRSAETWFVILAGRLESIKHHIPKNFAVKFLGALTLKQVTRMGKYEVI